MTASVRVTSRVLAGRDEELEAPCKALTGLREAAPGVVLISGRSGIGKTRLATALADRLRAEQVRVLVGACVAGSAPFAALIGAFRNADPPAVQVLDALTGAIVMRRSRLFELLRTTFVGLARRSPTVLVVDDLHWSDRATRDALLYLVAAAREGRWGLVGTFRDDEVAGAPVLSDFVHILGRDALVRITLAPLSRAAVADQMAGITGIRPTDDASERIRRRTGGIPLLVEELVAADEAGITGVPDHLRNVFMARLRSLGEAQAAVAVVAVAGEACDERLVADVLGADVTDAATALERAVGADVLSLDRSGYRMRHDLLREAVYDATPPGRRRELHRRIALAIEARRRPDVIALAHHWYAAADRPRAVAANIQAAELAERVHSPAGARAHLDRVLECWDEPRKSREYARLLMRTAAAAELEGAFDRTAALADQALAMTCDSDDRSLILERLMIYRWRGGDGPQAKAAFAAAQAALPPHAPLTVRATVLAGCAWFCHVTYDDPQALHLSALARTAAEESADDLARCRALIPWGACRPFDESGLAALREARELAVKLDASEELARAHIAQSLVLRRLGRSAERAAVIREGLRDVAAHGLSRSFDAVLTYQLVETTLDLGAWDEAASWLADLSRRELRGIVALFASGFDAQLAAWRGDGRAADAVERTLAMGRRIPQQNAPVVAALLALADLDLWGGNTASAREHIARAKDLPGDPVVAAAVVSAAARLEADVADAARRRGRPADPNPPAPDVAVLEADPSPVIRAHAVMARAERSRLDRDPEPWRAALGAWVAAGDPYRTAYCQWRAAGAVLRNRTGKPEAARLSEEAWRVAHRLGARPLREAIERSACAARIPLEGGAAAAKDVAAAKLGLTARERELLPLVVAGRTNAEIADALYISSRTVEVHISSVMRKLGATRRTEAADLARRYGLAD